MKTSHSQLKLNRGFTLIELLVVIAVIAILAALLFPAGAKIMQNAAKKRAFAELNQVATAIDSYKNKLGFYPPDNPNNYAANTLYYELAGCRRSGTSFVTLNGQVNISAALLGTYFGASGIMNSSAGSSSDEGASAQTFLRDVKPNQYGERSVFNPLLIRALGVGIDGQVSWPPQPLQPGDIPINPFRYNSSSPSNNVNSYDLWVDIVVGGKTNRISNWNPNPQIL